MVENGASFNYVLRDTRDERYLGDMTKWFADPSNAKLFQIGDSVDMPDEIIFQNNSKRIRECRVDRILFGESIPTLYLMPTMREAEIAGYIDGKKFFEEEKEEVDWSGSDGWLKID